MDEKIQNQNEAGKLLVRYWIEDGIVETTTVDVAEHGGYLEALDYACDVALQFDCAAFNNISESDLTDEQIEELDGGPYEPSLFVDVYDPVSDRLMFWANTEGERGSDYDGENSAIDNVIDACLRG